VKSGRFRQDLYYRLNVLRIVLPPLRDRREDLPLLIEHFRVRYASEQGRPLVAFSPEAMRAMLAYTFPGNVRELENAVERAVTLAHANTIELVDLPPEITGGPAAVSARPVLPDAGIDLEIYLTNVERSLLTQALERTDGVRTRAATLLGLSFRSFRYRLAKLGITSDAGPDEGDDR
jgi:two-component system response regulator PilR (NtrC family)